MLQRVTKVIEIQGIEAVINTHTVYSLFFGEIARFMILLTPGFNWLLKMFHVKHSIKKIKINRLSL